MSRRFLSAVSERVAPRVAPPRVEPCVRADQLDEPTKRALWAHIRAHEPEQLGFLQDPYVSAFVKRTGAVHVFPKAMVDAALRGTSEET
jgi:hypothetical protein